MTRVFLGERRGEVRVGQSGMSSLQTRRYIGNRQACVVFTPAFGLSYPWLDGRFRPASFGVVSGTSHWPTVTFELCIQYFKTYLNDLTRFDVPQSVMGLVC